MSISCSRTNLNQAKTLPLWDYNQFIKSFIQLSIFIRSIKNWREAQNEADKLLWTRHTLQMFICSAPHGTTSVFVYPKMVCWAHTEKKMTYGQSDSRWSLTEKSTSSLSDSNEGVPTNNKLSAPQLTKINRQNTRKCLKCHQFNNTCKHRTRKTICFLRLLVFCLFARAVCWTLSATVGGAISSWMEVQRRHANNVSMYWQVLVWWANTDFFDIHSVTGLLATRSLN